VRICPFGQANSGADPLADELSRYDRATRLDESVWDENRAGSRICGKFAYRSSGAEGKGELAPQGAITAHSW